MEVQAGWKWFRRLDAEQREVLRLLLNSICLSPGYITLCQVVWIFFFLSKEYLTSYNKKNGPLNYLWHVLCAVEEQSSLSQCAAPEPMSSGDSQERIYGPWGEICLGPAEQDKILKSWGFFSFFPVEIVERCKPISQGPRLHQNTFLSQGSQTWACKGQLI